MNVDRDRLVETASRLVGVPSFTGDEEAAARLMVELFESMGLQVQWQQVEEGRANALGTWAGAGGGESLMFNGHLDTSYSGREPWLRGVPGFQPQAFERDGRLNSNVGVELVPAPCRRAPTSHVENFGPVLRHKS